MKKLIAVLVTLTWGVAPAMGQLVDEGPVRADVNVTVGIPDGELEDGIDGEAVGLSAFVGGPVPNSPIVLGSELGFMNYGMHSRLSVHSTVFDEGIDDEFAVPVEAVNTSVSNNIWTGHLVLRLQPSIGPIQPYVDGLAGVKYFNSRLNVESDIVVFRGGLSQDANVSDFALSYGAGAGIEIQLYQHQSLWSDAPMQFSLHGGARYLFGRAAHYARGGIVQLGDRLVVNEVESETNLLQLQFGIRVAH